MSATCLWLRSVELWSCGLRAATGVCGVRVVPPTTDQPPTPQTTR